MGWFVDAWLFDLCSFMFVIELWGCGGLSFAIEIEVHEWWMWLWHNARDVILGTWVGENDFLLLLHQKTP